MSLKDKFNKLSKEKKIVGGLLLLLLFFIVVSIATAPAQAQLVGRGPEPVHVVGLTVQTTAGRRVDGMTVAVLPPIGYVFVDARGGRWRIVGGAFGPPSCSSTKCGIRATVTVEPDGASKPTG